MLDCRVPSTSNLGVSRVARDGDKYKRAECTVGSASHTSDTGLYDAVIDPLHIRD
jgi:hypothetical protein